MQNPLRLPRKRTVESPKVGGRTWCDFAILNSKYASRHSCVHFFEQLSYQKVPDLNCLKFSLWPRYMFRATAAYTWATQLPRVLRGCFWLGDVLCANAACTFCADQLPNGRRSWGVFNIWLRNMFGTTAACNFLIFYPTDGSAPAALANPLFHPPRPKTLGKHSFWRLVYLFARSNLLSTDSLSSLTLPAASVQMSEVWHPNFLWLYGAETKCVYSQTIGNQKVLYLFYMEAQWADTTARSKGKHKQDKTRCMRGDEMGWAKRKNRKRDDWRGGQKLVHLALPFQYRDCDGLALGSLRDLGPGLQKLKVQLFSFSLWRVQVEEGQMPGCSAALCWR